MRSLYFIIVLFLTGCSTAQPPIAEYRIAPKADIGVHQTFCKKHSIKLAPLFVNSSLLSNHMRYRVGEYKEYNYTQSAWREAPSKEIANQLVNILNESALFDGVYAQSSSRNGDLLLEISVNDFIQVFNEEENRSHVKLDISLNLIENKSGELISFKSFSRMEETKSLDAKGGVEALNKLLGETYEDIVMWLSGSCK